MLNENIVGEKIGIFDVLYECNFRNGDGHKLYHVKCLECGWESDLRKSDIVRRNEKCIHTRVNGSYITFQKVWNNKRLKSIFDNIVQRCYNPNNKSYRWYGAKGVGICEEWINNPKSFEEWALHNGYNDGLTIDRINENEDYSPNNCRWVSNVENAKYKSTTSIINVNGEIHSGKDWAKILGVSTNLINKYIRKYGLDNTIEFIKRYLSNPSLDSNKTTRCIYDLYMN